MKRTIFFLSALALIALGIAWWTLTTDSTYEIPSASNERDSQENVPLPPITLVDAPVTLPDGTQVTFKIAEPFTLTVAAEDLGKARFLTKSPDGRIFVPDLVDYNLSREGKIYILDDFNEETGVFETKQTYLENLRGPNSVAFYTDENGQMWIYIALTAQLVRYPYEAGDVAPEGEPEIILEFPNTQAPNAKSVVWHITRTVEFYEGKLYVAIGSGCNACEQPEGELRGMIARMDPDGRNRVVYAEGLRNAVGITWADGVLYATENGVDHLGAGAPDDLMYRIGEAGGHYGWPYCYETDGEIIADTSDTWERDFSCEDIEPAFAAFPPHAAPLGLHYFENAHPVINRSFLVALHGSFDSEVRSGYQIVRVSPEGEQEIFMDSLQGADGTRYARPVDFLPYDERSFFFTDDHNGRLYYVAAAE